MPSMLFEQEGARHREGDEREAQDSMGNLLENGRMW